MYKILFAKKFIKAARKLERSGKFKQKEVNDILTLLASGNSIPASYRDHALKGDLSDRRECHVRGDILLRLTREGNKCPHLFFDRVTTWQRLNATRLCRVIERVFECIQCPVGLPRGPLLVYRKDDDVLVLLALDIGTHYELFGA